MIPRSPRQQVHETAQKKGSIESFFRDEDPQTWLYPTENKDNKNRTKQSTAAVRFGEHWQRKIPTKKKLSRKQHEKIMFYTNHFVRRDRAMLAALSVMCSITNFLLLPFHVLVLVVVVFDAATGPDSIFQKMGPGTWTERR